MSRAYYPMYDCMSSAAPLPQQADVVIAGAGIMGCAAAYYLSNRGLSVVVCDKAGIASQQSSRAWGFVRQQMRDPAEVPLMKAAISVWQGLEVELQTSLEWIQAGCLYSADDEAQMARFDSWLAIAREHELDTCLLASKQVNALMPALGKRALGGLYTASDGQAEPRRVTAAFAQRARERGVYFAEGCGVTGIDTQAGFISGVETERGYISTRRLVVAAGASSWRLLKAVGLIIPQQVVRCTVSRTSAGPQVGGTTYIGHGVGFRQRRDGSFNIADGTRAILDVSFDLLRGARWYLPLLARHGGMFNLSFKNDVVRDLSQRWRSGPPLLGERDPHARPDPTSVTSAIRSLIEAFPELKDVRVVESWGGMIDVLPDGIPIIDATPEVPGLVIATGFCGHGFALGPMVGQVIAELVEKGASSFDLHRLRLRRFIEGDIGRPMSLY
ncbi:FAD-binding oxidoreductase [Pseudomonas sp. G2-4]|uniref:NAD(P)/FAD-dependent oxidoreductase n=1 Tax=Pseudomonas sp. G2-4 TaxID=1506334 RepID=UPI0024BADC68|nr:FAD-binding oxidoreductase [Pseudomonas sp. G2-4]WHS62442.1 FAD-binding oxidoreductase [Pseudomonas sp. G2-4]